MTKTEKSYLKLVKASAWYDILVTTVYAFPILVGLAINSFRDLHEALGAGGSFPEFEPLHYFMLNLMGTVITIWSIVRIRYNLAFLGLYDAYGRLFFSTWMLYYLVVHNISATMYLYLIPEVLWGVAQFWGYWKYKQVVTTYT